MKKIIQTAGLAFAIVFGTTTVQAQEIQPYVGFGLGSFLINNTIAGVDNSAWAFGGYGIVGAEFNENIAAELRAGATGQATVFGTKDKLGSFFSYLAKIQMPVAENMNIYGLIGGTTANYKSPLALIDITKTSVSFGGGLDFIMDDRMSIGAEWLRYWHNVTIAPGIQADVDGITATVRYRF